MAAAAPRQRQPNRQEWLTAAGQTTPGQPHMAPPPGGEANRHRRVRTPRMNTTVVDYPLGAGP